MTNIIDEYAEQLNIGPGALKLILVLFLNYPISFLFRLLPPKPILKHVVGMVIGIFEFIFCLGLISGFHAMITSTVTLAFMTFLGNSPWTPLINFIWIFGYQSYGLMFVENTDDIDWTASQMVLTIKLTSVCFNVYDGTLPKEVREKTLTLEQQEAIINKPPTLLEWYGYVFFYAGFLAGPAYTMREYLDFINMTQFKNSEIPPSLNPTLQKLSSALLCLIIYLVGSHFFPVSLLEDINSYPFITRIILITIVPFPFRVRYYFIWLLTEGAFIANGFSFGGTDESGNTKWDKMCNIKPLGVELAQNVHGTVNNWNCKTHSWLKNYVYLRITPISQKPNFFSVYGTYFISSLWHGFYAGYYLFFLSSAVGTWVSRDFRSKIRPQFFNSDGSEIQPWKKIYDFLGFVIVQHLKGYMSSAFIVLSLEKGIKLWTEVYFFGHFVLIVGLLFVKIVPQLFGSVKLQKKKRVSLLLVKLL